MPGIPVLQQSLCFNSSIAGRLKDRQSVHHWRKWRRSSRNVGYKKCYNEIRHQPVRSSTIYEFGGGQIDFRCGHAPHSTRPCCYATIYAESHTTVLSLDLLTFSSMHRPDGHIETIYVHVCICLCIYVSLCLNVDCRAKIHLILTNRPLAPKPQPSKADHGPSTILPARFQPCPLCLFIPPPFLSHYPLLTVGYCFETRLQRHSITSLVIALLCTADYLFFFFHFLSVGVNFKKYVNS